MQVDAVEPGELDPEQVARWEELRRACPWAASPFFSAAYTQAVGAFRPETRVAVVEDGGRVLAFLPFERRRRRALPVGPGLTDYQGSISLYKWLLPGFFTLGLLTNLAHHFAGRGYPKEAAAIWFVGLAVNIVINVAFLPGRGAWVASLASSVAYAILLGLHVLLFVRETGRWSSLRPRLDEIARMVRGR